jgi:hypothetical protein
MKVRCWKCGELFEPPKTKDQRAVEYKQDESVAVCPQCKSLNRL